METEVFSQPRPGPSLSGGQSGTCRDYPGIESADSESVDELIEEGNAFEADVVSGVEGADNADEQEVRTHEVPEDDVPDEYLRQRLAQTRDDMTVTSRLRARIDLR